MLTFPDRIRVSECAFNPTSQSVTGGQSITGFQQYLASPRGRWTAKLTCQIVGEEETLLYQGFLAALGGSANLCLVGPRDGIRPRDGADRVMPWKRAVPWANGAQWFNGAGWAAPPRMDARAGSSAAQGTAGLLLVGINGSGVRPGHHLGILGYLYRVLPQSLVLNADGSQYVTFWPRLRTAVPAGTPINLASPQCTMRLRTDDSGALSLRWREQATPSLEFVEAMPAPGS